MATREQRRAQPVSLAALWFGLLGGAFAWTFRLLISYPLVPHICETGLTIIPHAISFVFLVVSLAATYVAWGRWLQVRDPALTDVDEWGRQRAEFMGVVGMLSSGMFALVIVAEWLPTFFVDPCIGV
jgi:hypothetical protein